VGRSPAALAHRPLAADELGSLGIKEVVMHAVVRMSNSSDARDLAALRWQSRTDEERSQESFDLFVARFCKWYADAMTSECWFAAVAVVEETLVGCMYLRCVDTVPVPGVAWQAWGYVTHAFVSEGHRNSGIGRQLLALLIKRGQILGLKDLQVWPSRVAVSLYVRAGFQSPEAQRSAMAPDEASYVLPLARLQP